MEEIRKKIKNQYDSSVESYIVTFKNCYFKNVECEDYWIGEEIGGVFFINDYYFNFDDIRYAIDNQVCGTELFAWHNYVVNIETNNSETQIPTLKEWWESKNNTDKRLKYELSLYRKNIMDFKKENLVLTNDAPTEDGYYVVLYLGFDGVFQRTNQWKNGKWLRPIRDKLIARSADPIKLKTLV